MWNGSYEYIFLLYNEDGCLIFSFKAFNKESLENMVGDWKRRMLAGKIVAHKFNSKETLTYNW